MIGYTKSHRDRFNHPLFKSQKYCRGYAWDWMVAHAAFKVHDIEIKGQTVTLQRGQFSHSLRHMSDAFGWSLGVTQRFIARLKTEEMIDTTTGSGQIVVTICNYSKYQASDLDHQAPSDTANDTGTIQERYRSDTIKKEGNKVNNTTVDDNAPATDFDILAKKLEDAGGEALNLTTTGLMVLSTPLGWLEQGCDMELDIVPTIRAIAAKSQPQSISSWNYFTAAIADAKARRITPMPKGNSNVRAFGGRSKAFDLGAVANELEEAFSGFESSDGRSCGSDGGPVSEGEAEGRGDKSDITAFA